MKDPKAPYLIPFIVITCLFFIWGFITVLVDALIPRLREVFTLTYFQAGLVQVAFFGAYFTVSLPAGAIISKVGYKRGVIIGLSVMAIGCLVFLPAASLRTFPLFLLALFILAGGMTLLQVAANPYVVALGPPKTAASRLNLSQAFNSLGTAIAPLVAASMILGTEVLSEAEQVALSSEALLAYQITEAEAVRIPFFALGLILFLVAAAFLFLKLPQVRSSANEGEQRGYGFVLKQKGLMLGALGIFVYVGAEVTIGSYIVNYFLHMDVPSMLQPDGIVTGWIESLAGTPINELNPSRIVGTFVTFYWAGAMIGRFLGAGLLRVIPAHILLAVYAIIAALLCLVSANSDGFLSVWSLLAIGFCNSIMFPTIFSLATNSLPHSRSQGSGVLCAAIVGGAVFPPLFGLFADHGGFVFAFILPVICYVYIACYGFTRNPKTELQNVS